MDILAGALTDTFWFLVVFTVLVFVHELGHFLVARRYGVGVEVFSIGFGPEIRGWTDSKGTRWKISGIPLGGYVKFCGDSGAASQPDERVKAEMENTEGAESGQWLTPEEREASYHFKPVGQRAAVSAAGPLARATIADWLSSAMRISARFGTMMGVSSAARSARSWRTALSSAR